MIVYVNYFFLRSSVMLFVLRLLPTFKRWQKWVTYAALCMNLAITIEIVISYGLSCIPFRAEWDYVPDANCYSKDTLVIVSVVNGGM